MYGQTQMIFYIKVDQALVAYLGNNKIRVEELMVIACLNQGKIDILKAYLSKFNPDQCVAYMLGLERKLLIRRISDLENFDWDNYELTDAGYTVAKEAKDYIVEQMPEPQVSGIGNSIAKLKALAELTDRYLGLFPESIKNAGGERLKSNRVDTEKKMDTFMKKYKVKSEDDIIMATQRYLDRMRGNGYAYCSSASYFIMKDGVSKLASEIEALGTDTGSTSQTWDNLA